MNMLHSLLGGVESDARKGQLRRALRNKKCLRVLEAHSPLSALVAEHAAIQDDTRGERVIYDALWSSSLTDSTLLGKPDIEMINIRNRVSNFNDIFEVTTTPLIVDGDTGGKVEHFVINVRSLERIGVAAVIIEDKIGLKKNSLLGTDVYQQQDSIENFCHKIRSGKAAQVGDDFMIIARIESLILDAGMDDALERAAAYVDAGADGIMIHSRRTTPGEVLQFAEQFRTKFPDVTLVCVPTSYAATHFSQLEDAGFNIVIYANHMLRSAYVAMQKVASEILRCGRTLEIEPYCTRIDEILDLIPGTR
jgi:phosphoenolpyruvate phosphomutase